MSLLCRWFAGLRFLSPKRRHSEEGSTFEQLLQRAFALKVAAPHRLRRSGLLIEACERRLLLAARTIATHQDGFARDADLNGTFDTLTQIGEISVREPCWEP